MQDDTNVIEGKNWKTSFELSDTEAMRFDYSGKHIFSVMPVSFGTIGEETGISRKCRQHHSLDGLSSRIDMENLIPFGPEPSIKRTIEFAYNRASVTCDVNIPKGISGDRLSIYSILLPGKWKKIGIIENNGTSFNPPEIRWHDIKDEDCEFFSSEKTFLSCVLEDANGFLFETGAGNDLWRWNSASILNTASSFRIEKNSHGILISRNVFKWEQECELPKRNWRFNWYFAWSARKNPPAPVSSDIIKGDIFNAVNKENKLLFYDFLSSAFPPSGRTRRKEQNSASPCMQSHAVQNHFRKIIRSLSNRIDGHDIRFINIAPHICDTASHLERKSASGIEHWDMISILDLRLWADHQFQSSGSRFSIISQADSPFSSMPSLMSDFA